MCDTMAIVGGGRVLFAKNSDRDPNEGQLIEWVPAGDHVPGAILRCTWIEIPQAAHTNAVLLSRPFWMWGAEIGSNEHGVTIGNEAVFTTEPYADTGLTGMDLLRLALERSSTAHGAVGLITAMLERHGQGGGCGLEQPGFTYHNSFIVADPTEAFVLETAGAHWEVEQITSGARSISNGLTIPGFADQYSDWLKTSVSQCRTRQASTQNRAAAAGNPADLFEILRDHGDGRSAPHYSWLNGAMSAPCMHGGGLATGSQTTASWAADLSTEVHWVTGTAAPCTSIFKPVSVSEAVSLGTAPSDHSDGESLWWQHERLHRNAIRNPEVLFPLFVDERDRLEQRWLEDLPESSEAFAEAAALERVWIERVDGAGAVDTRPAVARRYWRSRNKVAGLAIGVR